MTVYARSDLVYTSISKDHGGCGEGHARPVVQGAPAKIWALTCHGGCEDFLRSDPLWSSMPNTIPETVDEEATRKDVERRGVIEQQQSTADALGQLAKLGDLPAIMGQFMQFLSGHQSLAVEPAIVRLCPNGHSNRHDVKFCGTCGVEVDLPVSSDRGPQLTATPEEPEAPVESSVESPQVDIPDNLSELSFAELRDLADRLDAGGGRSKAELRELIKGKLNA